MKTLDELRAASAVDRSITLDVELRADGEPDADGSFTLTGHAAVFDRLSEDLGGFRERIKRGAFRKALDANQDVILTYNHGQILARTSAGNLQLREDPRGLYVSAKVVPTSFAKDLRMLMKAGVVTQMSFAFRIASGGDRWTRREVDGAEVIEREVIEVDQLRDVSVVDRPAYPQTSATMRSLEGATLDVLRSIFEQLRGLFTEAEAEVEQTEDEARDDEPETPEAEAAEDDADEARDEDGDNLPATVRLRLAELNH